MIISALNKYYEILSHDEDSDIAMYGFSKVKVSYKFCIDKNAKLIGIHTLENIKKTGKKEIEIPMIMTVPQPAKRANNIVANFLCDKAEYAIGLPVNENEKEKTTIRFASFKKLHKDILEGAKNYYGDIFLKFLNTFSMENYEEILNPLKANLSNGGFIVFEIDGKLLHEDQEIKELWLKYTNSETDKLPVMQCAVTGKKANIAILHPSIKNVRNAQSSGASIVSFNADSYESYNKTEGQGLNSPISESVTFNYTTVLNHLLASDNQKVQLGDATTVFWAESKDKGYTDFMNFLISPKPIAEDTIQNERLNRNIEYEKNILGILNAYKEGKKPDFDSVKLNPDVKFYILGLSPNASRISIRFFYSNSFANIVNTISQHYRDINIEKMFSNQPESIPIWMLLAETENPNSRNDTNPLLGGSLMRSIFTGNMYPRILYNLIINRIRCDRDDKDKHIEQINYVRVSIIKGYLNRYSRISKTEHFKEVLNMSLNEKATSTPYLLGRLFAVLEKAQKDANPGINATIKDRYFSSACATPAAVFPTLLKLAQAHISKSDYGYISERRIAEIMEAIQKPEFPKHLSLEEQGVFIIGYYHQSNAFYKKSDKEQTEKEQIIENKGE